MQYFCSFILKSKKFASLGFIIFLTLCTMNSIYAQIILTEVMFDADTLESHNEYVEVYNSSNNTINLTDWKIGDGIELDNIVDAGQGLDLSANGFAVILDGSYFGNSTIYDSLIPQEALIVKIDDGSFGSFGWSNSDPESVRLVNPAGDTVQSYTYSIDNPPGYSDEKIQLTSDNSPSNWGNSTHFRGTPGFRNSITPYDYDLSLGSLHIIPEYPLEYENFQFNLVIKNEGLNFVNLAHITVFNDYNRNNDEDPGELLYENDILLNLAGQDTLNFQTEVEGLSADPYVLGAILNYDPDENLANNSGFLEIIVETSSETLVINEIMYRPLTGKSEWIELYNGNSSQINLNNWYVADSRDTARITSPEANINSRDYFVICADSTIFDTFLVPYHKVTIVKSFPTLNNDYDDLKILSPSGRIVDRVSYSDSWMGREVEAGVSLERINPVISASLADNWAASVSLKGGTPGEINSVYVEKKSSESLVTIEPNPFSPDSDGFEDVAIIDFSLPILTGFLTIDIYDMAGRKIKRLTNRAPVAQKGQFIWDGKNEDGRVSRIGLYILIIQIFDPSQNLYKEIKKTVVLTKK